MIECEELYGIDDQNEDICFICKGNEFKIDEGRIITCDYCEKSYHLKCLNQKRVPPNDFLCPVCSIKNFHKCTECSDTINGQVIKCSICYRNMDLNCLNVPIELVVDSFINKQLIWNNQTKKLLQDINKGENI